MDLFVASYPLAQWDKILALRDQDTRKAKVFRALSYGGWIPGQHLVDVGGGYDARTRCSRLEDLGVPIESRPSKTSTLYERRIPTAFLLAHAEKERQRWRAA
jgi:hypothetical protein